jgi:hypothetical protein
MSCPAFSFSHDMQAKTGPNPSTTAVPQGQLFPGSSVRPFAASRFWARTVPIHKEASSLHPLYMYVSHDVSFESFPMILHVLFQAAPLWCLKEHPKIQTTRSKVTKNKSIPEFPSIHFCRSFFKDFQINICHSQQPRQAGTSPVSLMVGSYRSRARTLG